MEPSVPALRLAARTERAHGRICAGCTFMTAPVNTDDISVYYQHAGQLPLASRVSLAARRKMFSLFMEQLRPDASASVLDVGVTSDTTSAESNYFEQFYPYPHKIVCVGTEDGSHLASRYPGLRYQRVLAGERLPFDDGAFDVVFSNAVLEHVGGADGQRAFLAELCRVAKSFFITTPNRWFPVEHHTGLPLVHHLPRPVFRALIRQTRYRYWADENHLNLLGARELARLFPPGVSPQVHRIRMAGFTSNLVAVGRVPR